MASSFSPNAESKIGPRLTKYSPKVSIACSVAPAQKITIARIAACRVSNTSVSTFSSLTLRKISLWNDCQWAIA